MTNWSQLNALPTEQLKSELFSVFREAAFEVQFGGEEKSYLPVIPRLADLFERRSDIKEFAEAFSALARSSGLWNYIDKETSSRSEAIVAEMAEIPELNIVLHREQQGALASLLQGNNLILSAPTSFGKSILIDALLLHPQYHRVAIILPTIALLDEFRRRLVRRFGSRFDILTHHSETSERDHVIFLGTQERLINREDMGHLDLLVVDEFYKLDPSRRDERSITLNAAVYRLLNRSRQFFFLGPNIDQVNFSGDGKWLFSFLRTRFSTVAVDTYDLGAVEDKKARLFTEIQRTENWPALVFVSSPDRANALAQEVSQLPKVGDGAELAAWMSEYYGPQWPLVAAVDAGIGVHHGRVPRALASRFITMFNRGDLPVLLCTSTLIEGVNTAAKSVLVYDKKIDRKNYDFFTFSNIKGRAGRLGQHHVGQVYLFHAPPSAEDVEITAPLFGDIDEAPDEFIVHIEEQDSTPVVVTRLLELASKLKLAPEVIRRFSSIGIDIIERFRAASLDAMARGEQLEWTGAPSYDELRSVCNVICAVRPFSEFGVWSDAQLAFYIHTMRSAASIKDFFRWHFDGYQGKRENIDGVFKFLRSAEYNLAEYIALLEAIVSSISEEKVDFSYLTGGLPRWFQPEALKILEEEGVPMQISERFSETEDTVSSLRIRLRSLAEHSDAGLLPIERAWILDAIPS